MTIISILLQILLTIPLTIILNFLSKKDTRQIDKIIVPSIYILIVSALIPLVKEYVFLIVILEVLIRNFYITNIADNYNKESNTMFIINTILSTGLSIFVYIYYISKVDTVFPTAQEIKPFLWFMIGLYLLHVYKKNTKNNKLNIELKEPNEEYILVQYAKFKLKYDKIVNTKEQLLKNTLYSVMIYEDYKHSKLSRTIHEYIGYLLQKEINYGVMQIKSYNKISDEESIKIAIKEYEKKYKNDKSNNKFNKLLDKYNPEEIKIIKKIYDVIIEFNKNK